MRINPQPAGETKFLLDGKDGQESKMISIPDYYKSTYNAQVTKPRLVREQLTSLKRRRFS